MQLREPGSAGPAPHWSFLALNCVSWYEAMASASGTWVPTDGSRVELRGEWRKRPASVSVVESADFGHYRLRACELQNRYSIRDIRRERHHGRDRPGRAHFARGRWQVGHSDLAGNVWEWVLDWYTETYPMPCIDCANLNITQTRDPGGSFYSSASRLRAGDRDFFSPDQRYDFIGVRCARPPP